MSDTAERTLGAAARLKDRTIGASIKLEEQAIAAAKAQASGFRSLVAGGVGGVCAVIVGHPFDLVKVRMQTAQKGAYSGTLDVVKKTLAREGFRRGLYAGVSAPLVGVTPMFAVSFWGYDMGKRLVSNVSEVPNNQFTTAQISAAGFFSAIPMTLITAPFERVKVLLQIQGTTGEKRYNNAFDVVRQLYRTGGVHSVFRGSFATLARDGPGSAAYFATYEVLKKRLTPEGSKEMSIGAIITAGGAAGIAMWMLVFPVDTVKSRLQGAGDGPGQGLGQVIRDLHRSGGIRAFFPGLAPALLRAVPANAATFLGVEMAHRAMNKLF